MAITINKELNVVSTGVPPVIHLSQYDSDFSLVFSLYASSGTLTMPNGTTAEIRGTKRDGNGYSASASVSGTTVTVTGDEQITACAGRNTFEIATYYNSKRLYTANFIIDVERAALDADTITSDTVLRELDAIIEGAEVAQEAAEAAEHSAAEAAAVVQSGIAITALQLMSSNYTSDSTPYLYRQAGGGVAVGTRELDEVVGGSVGWNQLVQNSGSDAVYNNGSTVDSKTNLSLYIQPMYGTNQPSINLGNFTSTGRYLKIGKASATSGYNMYYKHNGSTTDIWIKASESKMYENHVYVFAFTLVGVNPSVVDGLKVQAPQITDLTLLLGSTIADYIYGLETATAGSGVAKLKEWGFFTQDYYAYDAGSLQSVTGVSAHIMRDGSNNVIGNYPLDDSLTLRGIPKLSNNKLYYDGDVYASDGTVTRRYGIVDISDSSSYSSITVGTSGAGVKYCDISLLSAKQSVINKACVMSSYYDFIQTNGTVVNGVYKNYGNSITIYDNAFTDKNTAVSILQGKGFKIAYELATPTTETADPYASVQICAEGGTEEYVTTGIVPVGHNTKYPADLAGKLDSIPALPTTAGNYRLKVTVTGGVLSYEWVSA